MTSVVEKLMGAEKMLQDAGSIMPELAPIIDDVVSRLRAGAGKVINNSAQGGGSPASPSATPPSAGSGLMATPMPPAMGGQ